MIPAEIADEVAAEAREMTAYEDFVVEQVKAGEPIIGLYPRVNEDKYGPLFQQWRAKAGR